MANVYELSGAMRGIVVDNELVFPNVQTCVAVICVVAGSLVGVHVTLADRGRLSAVAEEVKQRGVPTEVWVIGPIFGTYNVNSFSNFGGHVRMYDCPGFIDVRARSIGGGVTFERRPTGGTAWEEIPHASFSW